MAAFLLFTSNFLFNITYNAFDDYLNDRKFDNAHLYLNDENLLNYDDYKTIGATTNYFILKNDSGQIEIINKSDIKKIKFEK